MQHFPKIQNFLGPSFNSFCSAFGFAWCLRKDYFYASDDLMFELIFPFHRKCFGLLSRESSHLRAHRCGEVTRSRVRSKIYFLRCFCLFVCLNRWLVGILLEHIVSMVSTVTDHALWSSPMIPLTFFYPTIFVSHILWISSFVIVDLEIIIFPA